MKNGYRTGADSGNLKKLNLGCGMFKKEGYVNVDCVAGVGPDIVHDLNKIPYPFQDNYFDVAELDHVLEHLDDPFAAMKELHRIVKPQGLVVVKVPHFSRGFTHPEHKRGFDVSFPYYFDASFRGGYTGVDFTCARLKLRWFSQAYLKRSVLSKPAFYIGSAFGSMADLLANISPMACSRFWCFLVGGFEEIEFRFICKKQAVVPRCWSEMAAPRDDLSKVR